MERLATCACPGQHQKIMPVSTAGPSWLSRTSTPWVWTTAWPSWTAPGRPQGAAEHLATAPCQAFLMGKAKRPRTPRWEASSNLRRPALGVRGPEDLHLHHQPAQRAGPCPAAAGAHGPPPRAGLLLCAGAWCICILPCCYGAGQGNCEPAIWQPVTGSAAACNLLCVAGLSW